MLFGSTKWISGAAFGAEQNDYGIFCDSQFIATFWCRKRFADASQSCRPTWASINTEVS
jgi:hypothetical protein